MFPRILTRFHGSIWREFVHSIKKGSFRGQLLLTPERIERILRGDSLVLWSWSLCLMKSLHNKSFALRLKPLTQETGSFRTRVGKSNPPNEDHPFISPAKGFFIFKGLKEWKESYMRQDDTKLKFSDYEDTGWPCQSYCQHLYLAIWGVCLQTSGLTTEIETHRVWNADRSAIYRKCLPAPSLASLSPRKCGQW